MPWYRLYVRNRDGHFGGVREFEALDEAQAIHRIDRTCHGLTCELWHDETLIRRWDGDQLDDPFAGTLRRPQPS